MASKAMKVSSMTWMIDIIVDDLSSEDGWYLFRSSAESVRGGFSTRDMSIWNKQGGLVAKKGVKRWHCLGERVQLLNKRAAAHSNVLIQFLARRFTPCQIH